MKHSLRFVIAGVFLAAVIFGVWALFFNPDKKISVNARMSAVNSLDNDCELDKSLNKLKIIYEDGIDGDELPDETIRVLAKIFGEHNIEPEDDVSIKDHNNNYSGYVYYHKILNEAYNFYMVYSNAFSSVSSRDLASIKSNIKEYDKQLKKLSSQVKKVLEDAKDYSEDKPEDEGLDPWFKNFTIECEGINKDYSRTLSAYAKLCSTVRNVCLKYAFGSGKYLHSTSSILHDLVIFQAIEAFNQDENADSEETKIVDLEIFCLILEDFNKKEVNIFNNSVKEQDLINSYTSMNKEFADKFKDYFELTRSKKFSLKKAAGNLDNNIGSIYADFEECFEEISVINNLLFSYVEKFKN